MYRLQERYNKVINRLVKKEVSDSEFNSMNKGLQVFYHKVDEPHLQQIEEEFVEISEDEVQPKKLNKKK